MRTRIAIAAFVFILFINSTAADESGILSLPAVVEIGETYTSRAEFCYELADLQEVLGASDPIPYRISVQRWLQKINAGRCWGRPDVAVTFTVVRHIETRVFDNGTAHVLEVELNCRPVFVLSIAPVVEKSLPIKEYPECKTS